MIPLTNNLQSGNWHKFSITSRREIQALLRNICEQKTLILILVGGRPVTWITAVSCDGVTLILDRAPSSEQNLNILNAGAVSFETSLDNIRIVFDSSQIREIDSQGVVEFAIDLPDRILRLQRREFYRVATPVIYPVLVCIPILKGADGGSITFTLADISCGGICLWDHQLALGTCVGRVYAQCRIDLPDIGVVTTGLQVRTSTTTILLNDRTSSRVGCQFVGMSSGHLSMVQRYVSKRECERIRASVD